MIKLKAIADCAIQLEKVRLDAGSEVLFGILAHLIVERGRPISRSTLAEYFWWNSDQRHASHCLRQVVYKLRRMGAPIETTGEHYTLGDRAALADFDCADERTLALSPLSPEDAVAVFPGYAPKASASFLTWLERTRERAGRSIRSVIVPALGEARRRNGWDEAAKLARQCLVLDPLNEEATLTLAEFTALRGDKREALRMIDGFIEEMGGTYADLRLPASLLRNRISERVSHPPASAAGKVPLVGREESLAVLANVAARVTGGAGQTCVIHGPPGIGKTRLVTEFANISAMRGARIVRVDCRSDAVERPLAVFMELAPQLLRMPGALGCSPEALKLVKRLGSYDPHERLDPDEYGGAAFLHAAVRSSLRDLVDAIASERPLYLLIEDVHWIDRVSLEVLKELIGSNRGRQLLVIMTARTLGDGSLLEGIDRRQLVVHDVPRLPDEKARALARSLCVALGIQEDSDITEWSTERSEGIPLYMTELLSHWRDTKDRSHVPASLEALIEERVTGLDKAALYTMQAVALLEGEATTSVLEAVLGMQRWQVIGCVEELDKGGLVVCTAEYIASRHSLLADAALQKMGSNAALMLHRAIASRLTAEIERGSTDPSVTWQAAKHWSAAGATSTALELVTSTARHMGSVGAVYEAAILIENSLILCTLDSDRLRLLNERRAFLEACGLSEELRENCRVAMEIESRLSGTNERVHSPNEIGFLHACLDRRRVDGVVEHALSCIGCETAPADHRLAAAALGMVAAYGESNSEAARRIATAAGQVSPSSDSERSHMLRTGLIYEFEFGDIFKAIEFGDEYLALARRARTTRLAGALRISSLPHFIAGHFDIVSERLVEAVAVARSLAHPVDEARALDRLAGHAVACEDYSLAMTLAQQVLRVLDRCPPAADLPMRHTITIIALMVGDYRLAQEQLEYVAHGELSVHGLCEDLAVRLLGSELLNTPWPEQLLDELITLNERLRERPGQETAVVSIAMALQRRGRGSEAKQLVERYVNETRREHWPSPNPILRSFATGSPTTLPREIVSLASRPPSSSAAEMLRAFARRVLVN